MLSFTLFPFKKIHFLKILDFFKSFFRRLLLLPEPSPSHSQTVRSMTDYNDKATIQRKVAANLLKYIIEAAQHLPSLSTTDQTVQVLENACSHGVNSVDFALAVCQVVASLKSTSAKTVSFTFNDLPDNDFDKVLALMSSSKVADYKPNLHTLGKSMYFSLMEPDSLDLVYSCASLHWISDLSWLADEGPLAFKMVNQAREDFQAYVTFRHQELRQGGKLVLTFPGVPDGQSGMNSCFPEDFRRVHEIVAERGIVSLAWMQKYFNSPNYSRNRAEVASAFNDSDWVVEVMELQDIEEYGAVEYRQGRITLDEIATRTADMLVSIYHSTFTNMWVEYGGMTREQAEDLMSVCGEALQQALKEPKSVRVYHLWVIVATKK